MGTSGHLDELRKAIHFPESSCTWASWGLAEPEKIFSRVLSFRRSRPERSVNVLDPNDMLLQLSWCIGGIITRPLEATELVDELAMTHFCNNRHNTLSRVSNKTMQMATSLAMAENQILRFRRDVRKSQKGKTATKEKTIKNRWQPWQEMARNEETGSYALFTILLLQLKRIW